MVCKHKFSFLEFYFRFLNILNLPPATDMKSGPKWQATINIYPAKHSVIMMASLECCFAEKCQKVVHNWYQWYVLNEIYNNHNLVGRNKFRLSVIAFKIFLKFWLTHFRHKNVNKIIYSASPAITQRSIK